MRADRRRLAALAWFTLLLTGCSLVSAHSTASPSAALAPSTSPTPAIISPPQNLVRPGTLTFLSDMNYPPQESIDSTTKQAVGSDIDIAQAIAIKMGLSATIVQTDGPQIISALLAKRGDAVISALAITPELQRQVALVGYFQSGQSIMVRKGNPLNIVTLSDLCGKNVGVQVTTPEETTIDQANGDTCKNAHINKHIFATDTEAILKLRQGQVDAAMDDLSVAASLIQQNADAIELAGTPLQTGPEGIAVDPKNGDLFRAIQQAMLAIYEDGTYRKILVKWNLVDGEIPASRIILTPNPSAP